MAKRNRRKEKQLSEDVSRVVKLKSLNYSLRNVSIAADYGYVPLIAVKTTRPFLINDLLPDFNIINKKHLPDNNNSLSRENSDRNHNHKFLNIGSTVRYIHHM
jgi:hypothetical protein